jgi:23S rRNA (adenine-C8)-methyltransferase
MQKISIYEEEKVLKLFKENNQKPFRYEQLKNAIYKNFVTDFEKIETIPKDLRKILLDNCFYNSLELDTQKTSPNNQTTKILFKTNA